MSSASHAWTSMALAPFGKGVVLPYRVPSATGSILVTAVKPRDGIEIGAPISRENYHLIDALAAAWLPGRMVLGARWICGASSIGVKVFDTERLNEFYSPWFKDDQTVMAQVCAKCRAKRDGLDGPCVYRVYDKTGSRLLYIGSTKDWPSRRAQHRRGTWWWQLAKNIDLTHFPTIAEARAAEAEAIRAERPQMNIAHNRAVTGA